MNGLPKNIDISFLKSKELEQVCVGRFQLILRFSHGVSISIESRFALKSPNTNATTTLDLPEAANVLLTLIGLNIDNVSSSADGTLKLEFSNGDRLEIYDSNQGFESYQIEWGDVRIIV